MMLSPGTDNPTDAPNIGFGITAPTPNADFHPVDATEALAMNEPKWWQYPYQTAWWKFVAPKSGWVCVDTHRSTTNFDAYGGNDLVPYTVMGIYIGEPGNLWPIAGTTNSIPLGSVAVWDETFQTWGWPDVNTSELLLMVDEGLTYYVQVGTDYDFMTWAPQALTNYVVTIREIACTPTEIVLGSRGAHDSPNGMTAYTPGASIIVGDPDTCLDPGPGYVEFPTATGARCGFHTQPATEHPDWPPPLDARSPAGTAGVVQLLMRYDIEALPGVNSSFSDGTLLVEGNANDVYEFYMSAYQYPNLGPEKPWDPGYVLYEPDASRAPLPVGGWQNPDSPPAKRGTVVNMCSRSEDFLATGEYRLPWVYDPADPPLVQAQKWYMWYGGWSNDTGFYFSAYQARGVPQADFGIWFGGYPLGTGFEFAIPAGGVRVHSWEWVVRWSVFTPVTGTLTGRQTGDGRAFSDG